MSKFKQLSRIEEWCEKGCGGTFTHTPATLSCMDKTVSLFKTTRKSAKSYTLDGAMKPERICLHFTGGALEGDLGSLTGDRGLVSVPFLIGRSGKIFQLFDLDRRWSYHLGPGCLGGNKIQSIKTIGIEVSNYGPLYLSGDGRTLKDAYNGTYCGVEDKDAYVKLDTPYRGVSYFASFTEAQYSSLERLVGYLCVRYNIPHTLLPKAQRSSLLTSLDGAPGILCHTNYRKDKLDYPPQQFDWTKLQINDVNI